MKKMVTVLSVIVMLCAVDSGLCAQEQWSERKSQHFIVYYQETPEDFADTVIDAAEEYYDQIIKELGFYSSKGWSFDDRARIYVFNDQAHYVQSASQASWSAGAAYYRSRLIKTYPSARGFFDSLLPHELGHIIFHEFIGDKVLIPSWFDEGVAMYQEKAKQFGSHRKVMEAIEDGSFIPLPELDRNQLTRKSSRESVELFYAESSSIVYFLIHEHGRFKFLNFCQKLKQGNKFNHALELAYPRFSTLERLNRAWVTYLKER